MLIAGWSSPLRRNARSADGIPFDARGQSRIAAMPRMMAERPFRRLFRLF
jgi:hypothetical protein